MHLSNALLVAGAVVANAKTIRVDVGKDGLTFGPSGTKAAIGDQIEFHYFPKAHSVVQSGFKTPCQPLSGGFASGFVPTEPKDAGLSTFTVTVKDDKPIWFYCGQTDHCKRGMVGSVNAPATGSTLPAFVELAKASNSTINPAQAPVGGKLDIKKAGSVGTTSIVSSKPSSTPGSRTTTYKTTFTSSGVVVTSAITATVPATKPTAKPTVPVVVNGAAQLGAGALAAVAAVAML
ncbi:hypothetical protein LMH87_001298 [Akanthomyces muscarius]|uniref:Extracellular serine-rich protein n=1 Tax=Akanthomyces muscarius TaxID=2231603 RepID=A0A9W8QH52_AKAMU|nr:hypothetical protein LMH87_001298 [Akanthomyces muscarius]KAJ4156084.1 hypothetical protein LMH87_001298 [Akanthomyces muscarius]